MRAIWAGALLVVYLAITGILLLVGWHRVAWPAVALHLAALGALSATTWLPRVPAVVRDWAPLLALLFLYSEIPVLIQAVGHAELLDATVIRWEQALFGTQPAIAWAARWPSRVASELLHAAYLSYYGIIFSVPVGLYLTRRRFEFAEAVFVLMVTFVVCFSSYIVFPVAGPRYLWTSPAGGSTGPIRATAVWLLETRSSRGTAFPSSHVAVAVTQSILAIRYFGRDGLTVGVLTGGLALGAVYGGFHYAVDVIAGAVVGALLAFAGLEMVRRLKPVALQAKASAPT